MKTNAVTTVAPGLSAERPAYLVPLEALPTGPRRYLFLDRDGTLVEEPDDEQVDRLDKVRFKPGVFRALARITDELDYRLVLVTNQDGLGTASFPAADFWPVHRFIMEAFAAEGIRFDAELIDGTLPADMADTRKPGMGMFGDYRNPHIDLARSVVIGDRSSDAQLAANLGARAIWLGGPAQQDDNSYWAAGDWTQALAILRRESRRAIRRRTTKETDVEVDLSLDGNGRAAIDTGIGFLDHMLEQVVRHSGIDLTMRVQGDWWVDEHHTVEDAAIVLGEAFDEALGDKRGLARYGFSLPMDDASARVEIDFGGRPWLCFEAAFRRERVGDLPTEMVGHFFRSFADAARCTLHMKVLGDNDHHQIEALFKAFARALRMAVRRDPLDNTLPTTKGML